MDFETMQKKVYSGLKDELFSQNSKASEKEFEPYVSTSEFKKDVSIIFENARLYFNKDSHVVKFAN